MASLVIATITLLGQAQSIAVTDSDIQLRKTVWKTHNPTDGSAIGGTMPLNYGLSFEPVNSTGMQIYVEGPTWATMMVYTQRPLYFAQPDHIQLDFDVTLLDANASLLETDMMVVVPVPNTTPQAYTLFNLSLQDLFSTGQLMNVNTSGPWINIPGAVPGRLLPVVKHHYTIVAAWNIANNRYGMTAVTLDGKLYPVAQSATGQPTTWSPGISLQFQISNAANFPAGTTWGSTSIIVDNIVLQQVTN